MSMHGSPPKEEDEYSNQHLTDSFLGFPDEIIEKIFFYLDFADRCKMRGINKRLYGIEDRMKKPLENRRKLEIIGGGSFSVKLNIIIGEHEEKVSLDETILLIHRFTNIFKFNRIVFSPSQKQDLKLLDGLSGVATDLFKIPIYGIHPNHLANKFDRSTICNLMQKADVVKILRVCVPVKAEDLLLIAERAQIGSNFCGITIRIPRKTARDFMKNIMGQEDKMKMKSWVAEKNEGRLEMSVRRDYGNVYKFSLYNSECGKKYPRLRVFDLYGDFEYDSEEESDDDESDDDHYDRYDRDNYYENYHYRSDDRGFPYDNCYHYDSDYGNFRDPHFY